MKLGGIKRFFLLALATFLVAAHVVFPVLAITTTDEQTLPNTSISYRDRSFIQDDLYLYDINFHDFSESSLMAFGLSGKIKNMSEKEITFTTKVNYFTRLHRSIAQSTMTRKIPGKTELSYAQMSDSNIVEQGYSVGEIYSYEITITIEKDENASILPPEDGDGYTPSKIGVYNSKDYVIDAYDIDIDVRDSNTYYVTEKITAYFNASYKHGIVRRLPLRATLERLDGTTTKIRTKLSDVNVVGDNFTTSRENGEMVIKIGDADKYVQGSHEYTINYVYDFGKDKMPDYDEFYYNLIGTEWDTVIGNVSFSVHMPKEFDPAKLGFAAGKAGSTDSDSVVFTVSGNDIFGNYNGILGAYEGLTMRLELDEGYFSGAQNTISTAEYAIYAVPVVCLIISAILWLCVGRDDHSTETVEFYPPEGLNSLDVALIMKGKVNSKDVVSLLFVLANKGYIRIEEQESKSPFLRPTYDIYKLKDYDGGDVNEKTFFDGLFKNRRRKTMTLAMRNIVEAISSGAELSDDMIENAREEASDPQVMVNSKSLEYKFYKTINTILERVNKKENRKKYFENTGWARVIVILLMIISFFTAFIVYSNAYGDSEEVIMLAVLLLFYSPFFIIGIAAKMPLAMRIFWLVFTSIHFTAMMSGFFLGNEDMISDIDGFYIGGFAIMIMSLVGMVLFFKYMPRRTPLGVELYGRIKGLKTFMKTADMPHLEQMLASDKNYAYLLLPYAFVLGLSTKWMKQFESFGAQMSEPDWYVGTGRFNISSMSNTMNSMMSTVSGSLSSSPSSSGSSGGGSSGGSSGGGSSGGGGGGGGGGSW